MLKMIFCRAVFDFSELKTKNEIEVSEKVEEMIEQNGSKYFKVYFQRKPYNFPMANLIDLISMDDFGNDYQMIKDISFGNQIMHEGRILLEVKDGKYFLGESEVCINTLYYLIGNLFESINKRIKKDIEERIEKLEMLKNNVPDEMINSALDQLR